MTQSPAASIDLKLHPRQGEAFQSPATEILYGGAAGGGKSHLMRAAAIVWCAEIPGLQVYLFRRIRDDLIKNHVEGPKGLRAMLAPWVAAGLATVVKDEIRFWNHSKIYLCHCKDEKDRFKYQGAEMHLLLIDELTTFTEKIYRFLRSRVRMVGMTLPESHIGRFPRILCGSNPGNVGHLFVKETFIDEASPMAIRQMPAAEGGMLRQFIPARLEDNPSMQEDDPGYEQKLEGLGSEALVRAMRLGDWNVIEGAYFDCWDPRRHVVRPFKVPGHWMRFRSLDWGSARPFSVGWWAVASETFAHPDGARSAGASHLIQKGALVRTREWYGKREANVGLKLTAEEVARGVLERTAPMDGRAEQIRYTVADPAIFAQDGGPSIAERMGRTGLKGLRPGDNKRVAERGRMGGWDQLRDRLKGEEGRVMICCFSTCHDSIRTIPALQHDEDRPEDLDSGGEDHAADEWRYACMSRPYSRPKSAKARPVDDQPSFDERFKRHMNQRKREREHAN